MGTTSFPDQTPAAARTYTEKREISKLPGNSTRDTTLLGRPAESRHMDEIPAQSVDESAMIASFFAWGTSPLLYSHRLYRVEISARLPIA